METKENKMGTMPVKRLILNMSLPMIISMMVQALYNVVDSIFVARLQERALGSMYFSLRDLEKRTMKNQTLRQMQVSFLYL